MNLLLHIIEHVIPVCVYAKKDPYLMFHLPLCMIHLFKIKYPSVSGASIGIAKLDQIPPFFTSEAQQQQQQQKEVRVGEEDEIDDDEVEDSRLLEILSKVRLADLPSRMGGGDARAGLAVTADWSKVLSLHMLI